MSIRIETRDVTPEMARHWLAKNKRNRAINKRRVQLYADEMRNGNWLDHHQGIAFYADGTLADGQHRLAAIELSGAVVKMIVAWNIPEESGLMIDGHQQRQTHQSIRISGLADWIGKDHVAVARVMIGIQEKTLTPALSHTHLINFCEQHKAAIDFSTNLLGIHKRAITMASMRAAVACAFYFEEKYRLAEFCEVILSGMPKCKEDKAAILIREWFIEKKPNGGAVERANACKRAMRAIKAFCYRQEISKLYQPDDFIYIPPYKSY